MTEFRKAFKENLLCPYIALADNISFLDFFHVQK